MIDRCERAYQTHKQGYNCAQSVLAAFSDLTGLTDEQAVSVSGAFGGGVGSSHEELCGAISGGLMTLSLLYPYKDPEKSQEKKTLYQLARDFRSRFQNTFHATVCGQLLAAKPGISDQTPAAARMGITAHCDIMIVTATEIVEKMLRERGTIA